MERTRYRLRLDLNDPAAAVTIHAKRCDSGRSILATLLSGGAVYPVSDDLSAVFTARKPDGKVLYNACTIEAGRIRYDLTPQTTAAAGLMECELRLFRGEQLITSPRFHLMVEDTVYDENAEIESTSEFTTLTGLVGRIEEMLRNGDFKGDPFTYEDFTPEQLEDLRSSIYGYYIPSLDDSGNLTFTPTSPTMPPVDGGNLLGPTPRLSIGQVTTLAPGESAAAALRGTAQDPVLDLSIPAGGPFAESADHPGCYCRSAGGETEWLNPPLAMGVEYRTAARWGGKPVYVKYVGLTYTATIGDASTYKDYKIPHSITGLVNCVRLTATLNTKFMLPYMNSTGGWFGVIEVNDTNLILRAYKGQFNSPTLHATIYYTKE